MGTRNTATENQAVMSHDQEDAIITNGIRSIESESYRAERDTTRHSKSCFAEGGDLQIIKLWTEVTFKWIDV